MISRKRNLYIAAVICVTLILIGSGCVLQQGPLQKEYSETRLLMGTIIRLDACYPVDQEAQVAVIFNKAWRKLEDINQRLGALSKTGDVARINNSDSVPLGIGVDTYKLLKEAVRYNLLTNGAFDVTVMPLIEVWKKGSEENRLPSQAELKIALQAVGSSNIEFLPVNKIRLLNRDTKIILGGIAKGYAVDEVARIFRENGFYDFLVDAGGDIYAGGNNCKGQPWSIGIRDPRDTSKIVDILYVNDTAITTSGDYARYYEIQNQRWSHIINPITGYPQEGVASATVIASTAMKADALSTALTVLEPQVAISLIDSLADSTEAIIFVTRNGKNLVKYESSHYAELKKKR